MRKTTIFSVLQLVAIIGSSHIAIAQAQTLKEYQTAKMQIEYQGSVGYLSQLLANKLNIGYYSYSTDPKLQVTVKQGEDNSLEHLLSEINRQIVGHKLRFEQNGDIIYLALTPDNIQTHMQIIPQNPPLLGEIKFANDAKVDEKTPFIEPALLVPSQVTTTDTKSDLKVEDNSKKKETAEVSKGESENKTESEDKSKSVTVAEVPTDDNKVIVEEPSVSSKAEENKSSEAASSKTILSIEERASREKLIQAIVEQSQDEKLIVQYAKRKQPLYRIDNKAELKLESIKSTKISTFLIFNKDVDLEQYKFEGNFQQIVKLDNLVAILHRQKSPPRIMKITTPDAKVYTIHKTN